MGLPMLCCGATHACKLYSKERKDIHGKREWAEGMGGIIQNVGTEEPMRGTAEEHVWCMGLHESQCREIWFSPIAGEEFEHVRGMGLV